MKLELTRVLHGGSRLGVLKGLGRSGQQSVEVPGCLLYTHLGAVPHLTQETLHTLNKLPPVTQVTMSHIAEHCEVLEEYKEGFRKFSGLHDTVLYSSLHDPASQCPPGYTTNKTVSVWGSGGRIELTVQKFMDLQKHVQPDWYQSMADGETWQNGTSRKRIKKSVTRTLAHLDECLLLHQKSEELNGVEVFGVVEGGDILEERVHSASETAKRPVAGFCLDGLQTGAMTQDLRVELIRAVNKELPEDKPRLLHGVGRPDEVLACVEAGVDLFEGFFPFQVTERGCALCFNFDISPNPELAVLQEEVESGIAAEQHQHGNGNQDASSQMTLFEMDLKDKRYQDDFKPLVEGCGCYCCSNHQRAYVHHLLVTNEMLAGVLLMIHNTAHYLGFFSSLREAMAADKLSLLRSRMLGEIYLESSRNSLF
ncbi:queuine tRNA-ribosyltransferase accessory subunit 2 isoform X2 [Synchiropus splendidus]|uniref:queuine tRNA-ribosyltransferase accessory subunit 2 isoform X2 n=1 Tax=Synchiropus splendidus TaxID=270530 RepID=UPI00237D6CD9|nr:queuine tRNA-ribosyltransferase accessory subunit 2 isoform X2 [Synchiropus splendidus]